MGMVGLFLVRKPDGTIPGYEPHEHRQQNKQQGKQERKPESRKEHAH
jgi:hypothetical protein